MDGKEINNTVFKNFMITLFVIIIFNLLVKFRNKENSVNKNVFFIFYTVFSFFIWLVTAPSIRMGVGIFLTLVLIISSFYNSNKSMFIKKNIIIFTAVYFVVLGLVPQTNNYFSLIGNLTNTDLIKIEVPTINYIDNEFGYGVLPEKGDQCWVNLECVRNKSVSKDNYFSYIIFKR